MSYLYLEQEQRAGDLDKQQRALVDKVSKAKRDLTPKERDEYWTMEGEKNSLQSSSRQLRDQETDELRQAVNFGRPGGSRIAGLNQTDKRLVSREKRVADLYPHSDVRISELVRGMALGDWGGTTSEVRDLLTAGATASVPGYVTGGIVDRARAQSVIFRAGAQTLVMDGPQVKVAQLTAEPAVEFLAESPERDLTDGSWTFSSAQLDAYSAWLYTTVSIEAFEDCVGLEHTILNAFAKQLALAWDKYTLNGSGISEPLGLANMTAIANRVNEITAVGPVDGYGKWVEAVGKCLSAFHTPTATIMPVSTWSGINSLIDADHNPMLAPRAYTALEEYVSEFLPSGANQTAIVGDFQELTVGVRTPLTIEVSRTAGDVFKSGFVAIRGYMRWGSYLTDPTAFTVMKGIQAPDFAYLEPPAPPA